MDCDNRLGRGLLLRALMRNRQRSLDWVLLVTKLLLLLLLGRGLLLRALMRNLQRALDWVLLVTKLLLLLLLLLLRALL
jgi:hypothetical protein